MAWNSGQGLYAELGDDGVKNQILKRDSSGNFVDTGYDLTQEQKQNIDAGKQVAPPQKTTRARRSRRTPSSKPVIVVEPKPEPKPEPVIKQETKPVNAQTSRPAPYVPGQVVVAEDVAGVNQRNLTVEYTGSFNPLPGEKPDEFARRREARLQQVADREAERYASASPGTEVRVSLQYEFPYVEQKKETNNVVVDVQPAPIKRDEPNFFGKRQPGRETVSDAPTYQVYTPEPQIADTIPQKVVLSVGKIIRPSTFKDIGREEFQAGFKKTPLGFVERQGQKIVSFGESIPGRFEEGVAGKEQFGAQQIKNTLSVTPFITSFVREQEVTPDEVKFYSDLGKTGAKITSSAVIVAGETIADPITTTALAGGGALLGRGAQFAKPFLTSGAGQVTTVSVGAGMGALAVADVASSDDPLTRSFQIGKEAALVGVGFRSGFNYKPSTKSFSSINKKDLGSPWKSQDEFLVLSPAEAQLQRSGIQRTLSGGVVSDAQIYQIRTSAGVDPLKKSPLGIDDFYAASRPSVGKGAPNLRLDESFGFPKFSLTESGQPVLTGTGAVGPRTARLDVPTVRAVDTVTGKEYNIPSQFLQRRLVEQPSLDVIGSQPRQLFVASDPVSAIATSVFGRSQVSIRPQLSSSAPSEVSIILTPRSTQISRPSFVLTPFVARPRLESSSELISDSRFDSLSESDVRSGTRSVNVLGFGFKSASESVVESVNLVGERSGVESGVRSGSRSGSRTGSRIITDTTTVNPPVIMPPSSVVVAPPVTPTPRIPRFKPPRTGGGVGLPGRSSGFNLRNMFRRNKESSLPGVRSASPGSKFIFAPGRREAGEVRLLRRGRKIKFEDGLFNFFKGAK